MFHYLRAPLAVALSTIATVAYAGSTLPNCGLTGKWHYNAFLGFGGGQSVVDCTITIKANGQYTGINCGSWITGQPAQLSTAQGTLKANAQCKMSGVIKVTGFPDTTVTGGKVSGDHAVAVGARGDLNSPTQVRMIILTRE
jgi:hypothetical protein